MLPVQPRTTKIRQVSSSVATVIPEIGFDDEPISPVRRDETVTKRNPKTTIRIAAAMRAEKPVPPTYSGLEKAMALRATVARTRREITELQRQLSTITEDQGRLRANLKEMPSTAKAYKRYLEKFDQQETQIETYQADIKKLQAQEHSQQKAFEEFLAGFSAE